MSTLRPVSVERVLSIWTEARQRLTEISDHGCEAASARAFEEGRLAVLDALGFREIVVDIPTDEEIHQRRRDLDEALRPSGTGQQMRDEPIVRRADGTIAG